MTMEPMTRSVTDAVVNIYTELKIIFPDVSESDRTDAIISCKSADRKDNLKAEWLERCVNHILLKQGKEDSHEEDTAERGPPQSSSPVSSSLKDSNNGITQHMVQQVENMFPDADRQWIMTSLVYTKQCFSDNAVDRTCNYMLEYPNRYKKKAQLSSFEPTAPKLLKQESTSGSVESVGKFNTSSIRQFLDLGSDSSDDELYKPVFTKSPVKRVYGAPSATVTSANKLKSYSTIRSPSSSIQTDNLIHLPKKTHTSCPTTKTPVPTLVAKPQSTKVLNDIKSSPSSTGCDITSNSLTSSFNTSNSDIPTSNSDNPNSHVEIKPVIQSQNRNSLPHRVSRTPLSRPLSDINSKKPSAPSTPVLSQVRRSSVSSTTTSLSGPKSPLLIPDYKVQRHVCKISPTQSEKLARKLSSLRGSSLENVSSSSQPGPANKPLCQDAKGGENLSGQLKKTIAQPRPVPILLFSEAVSSSMQFKTLPKKLLAPNKATKTSFVCNRRHSTPDVNISSSSQSLSTPPVNSQTPSESQPSLKKTIAGMTSLKRKKLLGKVIAAYKYHKNEQNALKASADSQGTSTNQNSVRSSSRSHQPIATSGDDPDVRRFVDRSTLKNFMSTPHGRGLTPVDRAAINTLMSTPHGRERLKLKISAIAKCHQRNISSKQASCSSAAVSSVPFSECNKPSTLVGQPLKSLKQSTATVPSVSAQSVPNISTISQHQATSSQKQTSLTSSADVVPVTTNPCLTHCNKNKPGMTCHSNLYKDSCGNTGVKFVTSQEVNKHCLNQKPQSQSATQGTSGNSVASVSKKATNLTPKIAQQDQSQTAEKEQLVSSHMPDRYNSDIQRISDEQATSKCKNLLWKSKTDNSSKILPCSNSADVTHSYSGFTSFPKLSGVVEMRDPKTGDSTCSDSNKASRSTPKETTRSTSSVIAEPSDPKNNDLIVTGVSYSDFNKTDLSTSIETIQSTLSSTVQTCGAKNGDLICTGVSCSEANKTDPKTNVPNVTTTQIQFSSSVECQAADKPLLCNVTESKSTSPDTLHLPDSTFKPLQVVQEDATSSQSSNLKCEGCTASFDSVCIFQCCEGHVVCTKCVEKGAKQVLSGESKGNGVVRCPCLGCSSSLPRDNLARALPSMILDLLDEKWTQENLLAIGQTNDLVKCPGCDFAAFVDASVEVFQCMKDSCRMVSCRHCGGVWSKRKHKNCGKTEESSLGEITPQEGDISKSSSNEDFPSHWTETKSTGKIFVQKLVQPSSKEWANVRKLFAETLPDAKIRYINRVQNYRLWKKYSGTRQNMLEDNGEAGLNEKKLFHGTRESVVENICRDGFDWRMCGRHAVVYGQGAYFARTAAYSHRFSSLPNSRGLNFPQNSFVPWGPLQTGSPNSLAAWGAARTGPQSGLVSWGSSPAGLPVHHVAGGSSSHPNANYMTSSNAQGIARIINSRAQSLSTVAAPSKLVTPSEIIDAKKKAMHRNAVIRNFFNSQATNLIHPAAHMPVNGQPKTSTCNQSQTPAHMSVTGPSKTTSHPQSVANMLGHGSSNAANKSLASAQTSVAGSSKTCNQSQTPTSVAGTSKATYHPHSMAYMSVHGQSKPTNQSAVRISAVGPPTTISQSPLSFSVAGSPTIYQTPLGFSVAGPPTTNMSPLGFSVAGPPTTNMSPVGVSVAGPPTTNMSPVGVSVAGPPTTNMSPVGVSVAGPPTTNKSLVGVSAAGPPTTNQPLMGVSAAGPPTTTYQPQTREQSANNNQYTMFLSRVLVGRTVVGKHGYRKPPINPRSQDGRTFDSCTDSLKHPQIFVIFDTSQAYPEYVITYTI